MKEKVELSEKLGKALVFEEGLFNYAQAMLYGSSRILTYADIQEFQDFTTAYFVHEVEGDLVLLRKSDGVAFRNSEDEPFVFTPDGTSVSDYADKM